MWNHGSWQVIEVEPPEVGGPIPLHEAWLKWPRCALEKEVHPPHAHALLFLLTVDNGQRREVCGID